MLAECSRGFGFAVDGGVGEHDGRARLDGGDQDVANVGGQGRAIRRAFDHPGRDQRVCRETCDHRLRPPAAEGGVHDQPCPARRPAAQTDEVGPHRGLADEDQPVGPRGDGGQLAGNPVVPLTPHPGAVAPGGDPTPDNALRSTVTGEGGFSRTWSPAGRAAWRWGRGERVPLGIGERVAQFELRAVGALRDQFLGKRPAWRDLASARRAALRPPRDMAVPPELPRPPRPRRGRKLQPPRRFPAAQTLLDVDARPRPRCLWQRSRHDPSFPQQTNHVTTEPGIPGVSAF